MTQQSEKAVASDQMFHNTTPSPEALAIIGKLEYAYETFGMSLIMGKLPSMKELLGGLTHALANQRIAPEYNKLFMDLGMFLLVNVKMHETLTSAIKAGKSGSDIEADDDTTIGVHRIEMDSSGMFKEIGAQSEQDVIPTSLPKPWCEHCQKHHDIHTQPANRMTVGLVTDQAHGQQHMMMQFLVGDTHDAPGLHVVLSASEAAMLADNLKLCADQLTKEQPKAS